MIKNKNIQISAVLNAENMQISECVWPPYWNDADDIMDDNLDWVEQVKVPLSIQRFIP